MNELAALKLGADLMLGIMEAAATVQKINAMLVKVQEAGGTLTDADWAEIDLSSLNAKNTLAAARKAAGFV